MFIIIACVALLGFLASLYIFLIEQKMKQNASYKPLCDISDKISCTKPILSEYNKIFTISNAITGMMFYAAIVVLALFNFIYPIFCLALGACAMSIYLSFIMFRKLKSICLICFSVYLINFILLVVSYQQLS